MSLDPTQLTTPTPPEWKVISFLFAPYIKGDRISQAFAWISVFPVLFAVALTASAITKPRRSAVALMIGIALCEIVNTVLKKTIKESRPPSLHKIAAASEGYGNPSSHAQYMGFLWTWYVVRKELSSTVFRRNLVRIMLLLGLVGAVCTSRVWNGHHTVEQIRNGLAVGVLLGLVLARLAPLPDILAGIVFRVLLLLRRIVADPEPSDQKKEE